MSDQHVLTLLLVGAHPADAFDLAAGTIAKHRERGDDVHIACLTHGARSHAPNIYDDKQEALDEETERKLLDRIIGEKRREFEAAAAAVGVSKTYFFGEADEPFVPTRATILRLAELYREVRPDILITHHSTEHNHHDHPHAGEISLRAVVAAGRWLEGSRLKPHLVPTVYFYGTQDRRDVTVAKAVIGLPATHVVDITSVIEKKKAALGCFGSQKYQGVSYNTPEYLNRRVERLEGYWGAMNASLYAEEFIARQPHQVEALPTVKVS